MDNVIGIIVAMQEELEEVIKIMKNITIEEIYNIKFSIGKINDTNIILVKSGIGKVNAARVTQIMIDKFNVKKVINVGSAGALNSELNIGDIVIADNLIQHDFDITAFNHKKGYITDVGDYIKSDIKLINELKNVIEKLKLEKYKIVIGTIASGDIFCTDIKMKEKIYNKFNAQCVEMEGAAIAQVCYMDDVPFVVLRSISDSPNGNNAIIFDEFVKLASQRCAKILQEMFN